jgi:uncharacterized protein YcbK (DUF882 family)
MRSIVIGAAVAALVCVTWPALADQDTSWVQRAISDTAASETKSEIKTTTRTKSRRVEFSGLARDTDSAPKRRPSGCVPAQLQSVLDDLEAKFGSVNVTSTCRSASANRAAGGAPQSLHLSGQAVDFRVSASSSAVMSFLSAHSGVGGLKHYGGGLFHIDTGARRPF